jgi:hypothetical protein
VPMFRALGFGARVNWPGRDRAGLDAQRLQVFPLPPTSDEYQTIAADAALTVDAASASRTARSTRLRAPHRPSQPQHRERCARWEPSRVRVGDET